VRAEGSSCRAGLLPRRPDPSVAAGVSSALRFSPKRLPQDARVWEGLLPTVRCPIRPALTHSRTHALTHSRTHALTHFFSFQQIHPQRPRPQLRDDTRRQAGGAAGLDRLREQPLDTLFADALAPAGEGGRIDGRAVLEEHLPGEVLVIRVLHPPRDHRLVREPERVLEVAAERGMDRLVITDHNEINAAQALHELDPEFGRIFAHFVKNGRIDAFPRKGKRGGAFCSYDRLPTPVYILLNHTNKLTDVMTLAHETGHGINDEIMRQKQNELNFGTPTSTAEVASTFMEDFVLQNLLQGANEGERFAGMLSKLNDEMSTIFRQVAFYRFEQQLHSAFREKGYLSAQEIGEIFRSHIAAYMGEQTAEGSDNWWMYVGHFRYFFYVYSYASGLLISKSLQNSVKESPESIANVKTFLATGLSESPTNIFGRMGVDITDRTFWERGLQEVDTLLTETERLAKRIA